MGIGASYVYNHCRRIVLRYNVENRTHKFLEKGKLPPAPRHPISKELSKKDIVLTEEQLQEIHGKNEQLYEYLKKVYLTSTTKVIGTPSKRPKPKKENERIKVNMFFEPKEVTPGHCTLTHVVEILQNFQDNSETQNASGLASKYNLSKKDVVQLIMHYSLFTLEDFKFMRTEPDTKAEEDDEKAQIQFEVYNQLEKKPYRQIEGK